MYYICEYTIYLFQLFCVIPTDASRRGKSRDKKTKSQDKTSDKQESRLLYTVTCDPGSELRLLLLMLRHED